MPENDNILEACLADLERGSTLSQVLAGLPPESAELAPLIRMAAELRSLPHPAPLERQRAPIRSKAFQSQWTGLLQVLNPSSWSRQRLVIAGGLVGVAMLAVILFAVTAFAAGMWWAGPRQAHTATLVELSGLVEAASTRSQVWEAVENGSTIQAGYQLRTGPQGSATLVFYDGSRAELGAQTELVIEKLSGGWGDQLWVELRQIAGVSDHSVVPFNNSHSSYQVHTTAGTAIVHGTVFQVAVDPLGQARFIVERGEVQVEGGAHAVVVAAGQATTAERGGEPAEPAYQFTLQGQLIQLSDGQWEVNGVPFLASLKTSLVASQADQPVRVAGRLSSKGELVADQIVVADEVAANASFTGILLAMSGDTWLVDTTEILVNELTELEGELSIGIPVEVEFTVLPDGRWQALKITSLEAEEPPIEDNEPDEIVSPTMPGDCTGTQSHPTAERLAALYGVPYEEIMGWFCQRFGFGEIEQAYELNSLTGMAVTDIFALRTSGLGWGQIRSQLLDNMPLLTEAITETSPLPETPTITETEELPALSIENACTGADPQPHGQTLATQFGVPYEVIMGWFCQGYGFGEIELAYGLSQEFATPVEEIFTLRTSGLGWGQIKRLLRSAAAESTDLSHPTKPTKPPKIK